MVQLSINDSSLSQIYSFLSNKFISIVFDTLSYKKRMTMKFGYMRVSTIDQNPDRQKRQLEEFGCERIFFEKVTEPNEIGQN
jgi:hypothetical protein